MLSAQQRGLLALIRCACQAKAELPPEFSLKEAYPTIRKHQIAGLVYRGVLNSGACRDSDMLERLLLAAGKSMAVSETQLLETEKLYACFDAHQIDYLPLKGIILKKLYPEPSMRMMTDIDLLIRMEQYDAIVPLMEQLGYQCGVVSDHELHWERGKMHVELHKRLMPSYDEDFYAYYQDGWRFAIADDERPNRYHLSDEDHLVYLVAHLAKHYRDAGIGMKHMVDLWIYREAKPGLNEAYIRRELEKLHLGVFYRNLLDVLAVWFADAPATEKTDYITDMIFHSGAFGRQDAKYLSAAVKLSLDGKSAKTGRNRRIRELVFLPYSKMCQRYPFLRRIPILLPVMWVVRGVSALLHPKRVSRLKHEVEQLTPERIDTYREALRYVGLEYHHKE